MDPFRARGRSSVLTMAILLTKAELAELAEVLMKAKSKEEPDKNKAELDKVLTKVKSKEELDKNEGEFVSFHLALEIPSKLGRLDESFCNSG